VQVAEPKASQPPLLSDSNLFLAEQRQALQTLLVELQDTVLPKQKREQQQMLSVTELTLLVVTQHAMDVAQHYADGVAHVEQMLRGQLQRAIGREVTAVDFYLFMHFHQGKIYRPEFQPVAFAHAVRKPGHVPDGSLSIEARLPLADGGGGDLQPIRTACRALPPQPMHFKIDASTRVQFDGGRYLHAWVVPKFGDGPHAGFPSEGLCLRARARQFSAFVLLAGRVASATEFEPTLAIVLRDKDDLKLPLLLEQLPTPKEFRNAIASLSPEQQAFAKGFRAMQLQSSLLGICTIQLKPQLERLLHLPEDSLAKEIQLTQDLLALFIDYQVPSDMLSYDDDPAASKADKLLAVKVAMGGEGICTRPCIFHQRFFISETNRACEKMTSPLMAACRATWAR
jgi:hypothetical protein